MQERTIFEDRVAKFYYNWRRFESCMEAYQKHMENAIHGRSRNSNDPEVLKWIDEQDRRTQENFNDAVHSMKKILEYLTPDDLVNQVAELKAKVAKLSESPKVTTEKSKPTKKKVT